MKEKQMERKKEEMCPTATDPTTTGSLEHVQSHSSLKLQGMVFGQYVSMNKMLIHFLNSPLEDGTSFKLGILGAMRLFHR